MKWHIVAALYAVVGFATADTGIYKIHLKWSVPTTRTDQSPLGLSELRNFTLWWTCDTGRSGNQDIPPTISEADLSGDWLGNCNFSVTATDTMGRTSVQSPTYSLLIKLNKPASGGMKSG